MSNDRLRYRAWVHSKQKYYEVLCLNCRYQYDVVVVDVFHNTFNVAWNHCVIEQSTGLKDKNGKLIYEGDIVELTRSRNYGWCKRGRKLAVGWNTFNCCGFGFGAIGNLTKKCADNCIVIGNIHENPELSEE